jgi:hypothetical protein
MQTNPNIILSGNQMAQPRLPDVNAMMQTRTAGMENIYAIEQQRAAQAQAAQKEQAAAAVEAMLPSVVAAYSDPSDAGLDQAVALMPAEVRDTFAPFVSRLKTVRDPAARKAIIEAELAKDDAGRAVLDRVPTEIQRMTADIQRGQLEVSRANAAREAAAAARGPEPSYKEIVLDDGTLVLMDTKSGRIVQPSMEGPIGTELPPSETTRGPIKVRPNETAEETKKRLADEKRAKDLGLAVSEIERAMIPGGLIDSATGGYLSNLFDTAAAVFSFGTNSSAARARLAPIADLALKMVPRFEGPQSNYDVQSYKDAAGDLANPNVPASDKRAAAEEIVRLFKKYQNQFEYAGDGGAAAGGEAGGNEDPLGIR